MSPHLVLAPTRHLARAWLHQFQINPSDATILTGLEDDLRKVQGLREPQVAYLLGDYVDNTARNALLNELTLRGAEITVFDSSHVPSDPGGIVNAVHSQVDHEIETGHCGGCGSPLLRRGSHSDWIQVSSN